MTGSRILNLSAAKKFFRKSKAQVKEPVLVDVNKMTPEAQSLEKYLLRGIVGQDRAVHQLVRAFESYQAGIEDPTKPLSNLLFLGPTGAGKTRTIEVFCEYFWGSPNAMIKMDCSEFTHSHEIAKLIGSPPGYLGHKETQARICKSKLEAYWDRGPKFSVLLFDEIEKGHSDLHQLLLGIMDKGILTLGTNDEVDLKKCFVIMTSNLGAKAVSKHLNSREIGYANKEDTNEKIDQAIYKTSMAAVKKFFEPEFVNRVDRVIVFRALSDDTIRSILDLELEKVQRRLKDSNKYIVIGCSKPAKEFLIKEGTNSEFGARELRRTVEREVVNKLARVIATKQAVDGDLIKIEYNTGDKNLTFSVFKNVVDIPKIKPAPVEESEKKPVAPSQEDKTVNMTQEFGDVAICFVLPNMEPCIGCGARYLHRTDCPEKKENNPYVKN
jgi:ATP-dependent Clp protease ATP-binding subunit ClpB